MTPVDKKPRRRFPVAALLGPTASGKSSIAMAVARDTGAAIVNCDALQIYRGLDVGTAKPSDADRSAVPHFLYDIRDPTERYSAGEFAGDATRVIDGFSDKQPVLLVGGTGLYYRALHRGIAEIPEIPEAVRNRIREQLQTDGLGALYRRLLLLDPAAEEKVRPTDSQRITRALEIVEATGKTQSAWIAEQRPPDYSWDLSLFVLTLDRGLLYDRILERTKSMMDGSWVREVENLLDSGVPTSAPAFQAIGYRQIIDVVQQRMSEAEALQEILVGTRQYAKRQATWFRRESGETLDAAEPSSVVGRLVGLFNSFSSGGSS